MNGPFPFVKKYEEFTDYLGSPLNNVKQSLDQIHLYNSAKWPCNQSACKLWIKYLFILNVTLRYESKPITNLYSYFACNQFYLHFQFEKHWNQHLQLKQFSKFHVIQRIVTILTSCGLFVVRFCQDSNAIPMFCLRPGFLLFGVLSHLLSVSISSTIFG